MKIAKILSQHRRDFTARYECEHCGHTYEGVGYDDDNFHRNVVWQMICPECGKSGDKSTRQMGTKYPDGQTV